MSGLYSVPEVFRVLVAERRRLPAAHSPPAARPMPLLLALYLYQLLLALYLYQRPKHSKPHTSFNIPLFTQIGG